MSNLMRIKDGVEVTLSDEFLGADTPSMQPVYNTPADVEEVVPTIDLSVLDGVISNLMSGYSRYDTAMDSAMVCDFHRSLPISRRQASDSRLWAWLGIVRYPDFVAWRWKPSLTTEMRTAARFYGDRVRQTFSRIWWAAELTRGGDDYTLTDEMFALPGFQDIYEAVFGRAFGNYQPALKAFVEVIGNKPEKYIRDFSKELGYVLTTTVLEAMTGDELVMFMRELDDSMQSRAAS